MCDYKGCSNTRVFTCDTCGNYICSTHIAYISNDIYQERNRLINEEYALCDDCRKLDRLFLFDPPIWKIRLLFVFTILSFIIAITGLILKWQSIILIVLFVIFGMLLLGNLFSIFVVYRYNKYVEIKDSMELLINHKNGRYNVKYFYKKRKIWPF